MRRTSVDTSFRGRSTVGSQPCRFSQLISRCVLIARVRKENLVACYIKKTTQTGMGASPLQLDDEYDEANESYNLSNDEADAPTI